MPGSDQDWRSFQDISVRSKPTLKPGDSVICDDLPAHEVAEIQDLIEAQGASAQGAESSDFTNTVFENTGCQRFLAC